MEDLFLTDQNVSIKRHLTNLRPRAVELIVRRARLELSDYRNRDLAELTHAVGQAYDNWCESVLKNDFGHSQHHSRRAIERSLAEGRDPAQVARTPWLVYEVTLSLLESQPDQLDIVERLQFSRVAYRLTSLMVSLGQLQINGLQDTEPANHSLN